MASSSGSYFQSIGSNLTVNAQTTTYTALVTDDIISCSASGAGFTVTIPAASALFAGKRLWVKKTDSTANIVTLATGVSTTLNTINEEVTLLCNAAGNAWSVEARYIDSQTVTFTPTGTWSANTTWTGFYRRVGDRLEIIAKAACSGAPTGTFTLTIPNSWTIDTAKITSTDGSLPIGILGVLDAGTSDYAGLVLYNGTTSVIGVVQNSAGTYAIYSNVSATVPITFGASDTVQVNFSIPITGWNT